MSTAKPWWKYAGHSAVGQSHIRDGLGCQDYFEAAHRRNGRLVVAIADGVGSAKNCQRGAKIAATTILKEITEFHGSLECITYEDGLNFGRRVHEAILQESSRSNDEFESFASTLLFAAFEESQSYFWQLGDGAWLYEKDSKIECATWPYKGEFNNQSVFTTTIDWESKWTHAHIDGAVAAIGFTDGMELFCLDTAQRGPHIPFVEKFFASIRHDPDEKDIQTKIEQLFTSRMITEREDDDLTLVIIWKAIEDASR